MLEAMNWNKSMLEASLAQSLSDNLITIVDETLAPAITYVGQARPGTSDDAYAWKIKRITISGSITTVKFANGSTAFDQNWSMRASITNWL